MHSENKVSKVTRYWFDAPVKMVMFVLLLILTGLFCEWPNFHPEHYFGANYHWWLDMIFHGGYYFVITILLYILFCIWSSVFVSPRNPFTWAQPVMPGFKNWRIMYSSMMRE